MGKSFKICTVVQGKTFADFLKNLEKAQEYATMVELRADSIKDFNLEDLTIIRNLVKVPSIFTFRHESEGGFYKGDPELQQRILKEAFDYEFTYVDVAYNGFSFNDSFVNNLSKKAKEHLILSFHDYEQTPPVIFLKVVLDSMVYQNPAMVKIATFVNELEDVLTLSYLFRYNKNECKKIIIGMGMIGVLTRLAFPRMGSYIMYVTMKGEENIAPGMFSEDEIEPLIKQFNELRNAL